MATFSEATDIELVAAWDRVTTSVGSLGEVGTEVAVLDLDVWGPEGVHRLCSTESIRSGSPILVVAVTAVEEVEASARALCAGARAVLLKETRPDEIVEAIHAVADGAVVLAPHLVAWLVDEMLRNSRAVGPAGTQESNGSRVPDVAVTPRQEQILALVASGLSNAEIAERLHVSMPTVKSHVSALLRTFDVRDRTKLALLASQREPA